MARMKKHSKALKQIKMRKDEIKREKDERAKQNQERKNKKHPKIKADFMI